jgi:hypothetical protein
MIHFNNYSYEKYLDKEYFILFSGLGDKLYFKGVEYSSSYDNLELDRCLF